MATPYRGPFLDTNEDGENCDPTDLDTDERWAEGWCGEMTHRYVEDRQDATRTIYLCPEHVGLAREAGLIPGAEL